MNAEILEKRFEPIAQDPNEILTVQQAAQVLKVSCSHMLRLIRGGVNGMPRVYKVRAGRTLPVRRGAITQWIRDVEHHSAELSDEHMRCRSEPSFTAIAEERRYRKRIQRQSQNTARQGG